MDEKKEPKIPDEGDDTPPEFDPQRAQAEALPQSRWGGGDPKELVRPVTTEDEHQAAEIIEDEEFGFKPADPSKFTGD